MGVSQLFVACENIGGFSQIK